MPYTFVFDLDGTLTKGETLPALAQCLGLGEEMQRRTTAAMQGNAPFAPDFLQRVALVQALPIAQAQAAVCRLARFEQLIAFITAHKKSCLIVTGNLDVYVEGFLAELGMQGRCISSIATVKEGKVCAVQQVVDKAAALQGLPRPLVCVGDGSNDVGMLQQADIAIAFGGAHPVSAQLQQVSDYYFTDETALHAFLQKLAAEDACICE